MTLRIFLAVSLFLVVYTVRSAPIGAGEIPAKSDTQPLQTFTDKECADRVALLKKAGIEELVVIARNFIASTHNYTYFNEGFTAGGGLYVFNKDGFRQLIDSSKGQILDAEVSYDGKTVLFSWRKDKETNYDLYVINLDGTGLKQLTNHPGNDFNASWLPDGGIAFLSDREVPTMWRPSPRFLEKRCR